MAKIPVGKRITSRDLESSQYPNVFRYVQHSDGKTGILIEDGFQFEVTSPEALEGIQAAQSAATQARDIASAAQATAQEARGNALAENLAFSYIEHRYARATAQPDTPMGSNPIGWTLTVPTGTETLWLSFASRRGDGALLSAWSTPATRMDSHPWMIFVRSSVAPATPSGTEPAGWSFAPPPGMDPLWAANSKFIYEGGDGAGALRPHLGLHPRSGLYPFAVAWSAPYLVSDAATGRNSKYLGKFQVHPLSKSGDTWLIYGTSDSPVQRGVWLNDAGAYRRIASDSAADAGYMLAAMPDLVEVVSSGLYGAMTAYGSITYFTNLAAYSLFAQHLVANEAFVESLTASSGFIDRLMAQYMKITGSIRCGDRYAENGGLLDESKTGTYMDASGKLKAGYAEINRATVQGGDFDLTTESSDGSDVVIISKSVAGGVTYGFRVLKPCTLSIATEATSIVTCTLRIAGAVNNLLSQSIDEGQNLKLPVCPGLYTILINNSVKLYIGAIGVYGYDMNASTVPKDKVLVWA